MEQNIGHNKSVEGQVPSTPPQYDGVPAPFGDRQPYQQPYAPPNPYSGSTPGIPGQVPLGAPLYGANPLQAVSRFYRKYAEFSGRASRSEYWWIWLSIVVAFVVLGVLTLTLGTKPGTDQPNAFGVLMSTVLTIAMMGSIVPFIALSVRRLHDADMSGWMYLLNFLPGVGGLVMLVLMLMPGKPQGARFDKWPDAVFQGGPAGY